MLKRQTSQLHENPELISWLRAELWRPLERTKYQSEFKDCQRRQKGVTFVEKDWDAT